MSDKYNIANYRWDQYPYFRPEETSEWIYTLVVVELTKDWIFQNNRFSYWNKLDLAKDYDEVYNFVVWEASYELFKSIDKNKCFIDLHTKDEVNNRMREIVLEKFSSTYVQWSKEDSNFNWVDVENWISEDDSMNVKWYSVDISFEDLIDQQYKQWINYVVKKIVQNKIFSDKIYRQLNAQMPEFDHEIIFWTISFKNKEDWEETEKQLVFQLTSTDDDFICQWKYWAIVLSQYVHSSYELWEDIEVEHFSYINSVERDQRHNDIMRSSKKLENDTIKDFIKKINDLNEWRFVISFKINLQYIKSKVDTIVQNRLDEIEYDKKQVIEHNQRITEEDKKEEENKNKWFFWKVFSFFWRK